MIVTTLLDTVAGDGLTSLREAVAAVNDGTQPPGTAITFDPSLAGGVLRLTQGELTLDGEMRIDGDADGDGIGDIVLSGDAAGDDISAAGVTDIAASIAAGTLADNSRVITVEGGPVTLSNLTVTGGHVDLPGAIRDPVNDGGGLRLFADTRLESVTVEGNGVSGGRSSGGGVYAGPSPAGGARAEIVVVDSAIRGNAATYESGFDSGAGGGLYLRQVEARFTDVAIDDNVAQRIGGGLFVQNSTDLRIEGGSISGNESLDASAGGLFNRGRTQLDGVTISGNSAEGDGGGIFAERSLAISSSLIAGNSAGRDGGGLHSTSSFTLVSSTVSGNSAGQGGGGIRDKGTDSVSAIVNTTIADNSAVSGGGGLFIEGRVAGNPQTQFSATTRLVESTVTGNTTSNPGGGIVIGAAGTLELVNSIVAGNAARGVESELLAEGTLEAQAPSILGVGTLDTDPSDNLLQPAALGDVFAETRVVRDPDGVPGSGDEILGGRLGANGGPVPTVALAAAAGNPALDAGDPAAALLSGELRESVLGADLNGDGDTDDVFATVAALPFDARGRDRAADPLGTGGGPDLGAVELQATSVALAPAASAIAEGDEGTAALSLSVTRTGETGAPLRIDYAVTGTGPAPADGADFAAGILPRGQVVFAAGRERVELTIAIAGNGAFEPDETFEVALSDPAGLVATGAPVAATILGGDPLAEVAPPDGVIRGTGRDDALASGAGAIYLPGDGADLLLVGPAATPGETAVIDAGAGDVVQLAGGLGIAASIVTAEALRLDLSTGARVEVLGADLAIFEPGANATTAAAGPALSYAEFAAQVLGVAVPASAAVEGGPATVPDATGLDPALPQAGPAAAPEGVIRGTGREDVLVAGAGTILLPGDGADRVVISEAATPLETTVVEGEAGDVIELVAGLDIAAFVLTPTAMAVTLATGAAIQLLEADRLVFAPGANATAGETAPALDYTEFARQVLGAEVPEEGRASGGPVSLPEADMLSAAGAAWDELPA